MTTEPKTLTDEVLDIAAGASTPKLQEAVCKGKVFPR